MQYKRNNIAFNEHLYDTMWSWFQVTWKTASTNSSCNCARGGLERRFNMWRRAFFWAHFLLEMLEKMVRSPRRNERLKKAWKRKLREWGLNWNFEGSTIAKSFCEYAFRQVMEDERSRARQVIDDGEYTVRRQVQKERLGQKLFVIHKFVHQICCQPGVSIAGTIATVYCRDREYPHTYSSRDISAEIYLYRALW